MMSAKALKYSVQIQALSLAEEQINEPSLFIVGDCGTLE